MDRNADIMARRDIERRLIQDGLDVWQSKKNLEEIQNIEEKIELRDMLSSYNPWGRPGNGAPMPGALRKTKLILDEPLIESIPTSVLAMGRPGHGAPLRTKSGRTKTYLKQDPLIRFQFHEPSRRSVDNDLRYKASPVDQENYKRQLDAIVTDKKRTHGEEKKIARKQSGWSNDITLRKLETCLPHEQEQVYEISGGVELVPLLAKNRMVHRCPLSTTDVTRLSKVPNGPISTFVPEGIYYQELTSQVAERHHLNEVAHIQDVESSRKHFETWKGFWGRPGNGAPKGPNLQKEKLEVILYHLPAQRNQMQGIIH